MTKLLASLFVVAGVASLALASSGNLGLPDSGAAPARSEAFTASVTPDQGLLELRYRGQKLLVYAYASNQFKPYLRELSTTRGDNVLLDAPPDHLHHHGLMYGIRVNGINFWEERDQPGHERSVLLSPVRNGRSEEGLPQASFTQLIHWVAYTNRSVADTASVAVLIERRTLTLTVDPDTEEVALRWDADFEVGPGAPKASLTGASYHGLGLRLPPSFNISAHHRNSEGAGYPTGGTGDVTPARWSCVSHQAGDHEVSVTLFGRPSSERGLPVFFTMVRPFTYLSVTQGLDKRPIELSAGDKFSLRYLLTACPKSQTAEDLQQRYQRWTKSISLAQP